MTDSPETVNEGVRLHPRHGNDVIEVSIDPCTTVDMDNDLSDDEEFNISFSYMSRKRYQQERKIIHRAPRGAYKGQMGSHAQFLAEKRARLRMEKSMNSINS